MYSELVYFNDAHFAHIAAREEHFRMERIRVTYERAWKRREKANLQSVPHDRKAGRGSRPVRHLSLVS